MLTDQEVIEGLRAGLSRIQPPSDLVDRLREEAEAGHRGLTRRGHGRRSRRIPVGSLAVACSGLVAVTVALAALLLIGHHATRPVSPTGIVHQRAGERVPTLEQLEANFAVLRRPQTAADRSARPFCPNRCVERIVPRLTRLARVLPGGTRVFLSVWRLRVAGLGQPVGSYALHEDVIAAGSRLIFDPGSLEDIRFEAGGTFAVLPSTITSDRQPAPLWSAMVPDGVSTVRWTFGCPPAGSTGRCRHPAVRRPMSIDVPVIDNIAAAEVPGTGSDATGRSLRVRTGADWYASDGRQVARFRGSRTQPQISPPFLMITRLSQDDRLTLTAVGLGPTRFGSSPDRLRRMLTPILGRPQHASQTVSECGIDQQLTWPILIEPTTGRLIRSEELQLFLYNGRLVGYQYGGDAGSGRSSARLRLRATTTRGLAVGDPLSRGQRLYGHAFQISSAQGETWQAHTATGTIRGYAYGQSAHGDVSPDSLVASIDAGNTGCPSQSP